MLDNPDKSEGRPSAASTRVPTTARPSAASQLSSSSAAQPFIDHQVDVSAPEHTSITVAPSSLQSSLITRSNLAPAEQSFVGEPAQVPQPDGETEELVGLSSAEAARLLEEHGRNEIPEHDTPWYILLAKQFWGVMPVMLELAALVSAIIPDWGDFAIIMAMLICNALIGFHEEHKAKQSLDALKSQMTATVPVKRDGAMVIQPVAELVPGDIVFLRGGNVVPADCQWLEGDEMQVDTAALTGEPIPRKVGGDDRIRKLEEDLKKAQECAVGSAVDPSVNKLVEQLQTCKQLLSGCIIKQGEGHCVVIKTGLNTEIGQAAGLVQEASGHQAGVFETKIMQVVKAVILISLIDAGVLLYVQVKVRGDAQGFTNSLLAVLAIVIGAVPIALPLVMQVTMAIGAKTMAKRQAIVTHLTALQEIASMTVLCSDKTGTLTTADMRVMPAHIWTMGGHSKDDCLVWSGVASNAANKEDPIDSSVLKSCMEHFGEREAEAKMAVYKKKKFIGFNPTTKRTVVYCEHPQRGNLKIAKGLSSKILCTGDDGGDCWSVENLDVKSVTRDGKVCKAEHAAMQSELKTVREAVQEHDLEFSLRGFKTLGVAMSEGEGGMQFAGIVPMLDPPRHDTMTTIHRVREAGINVKMITGDHLNIAIETARLVGLGAAILPASDLWPASAERDETIVTADGFAQVLPKDKREVILVLQNRGLVIGMTGDGVNDAPALAQAQIGIAVDGATEAARSAADIILTQPGLSAIFDAVVESRKIFARLRAYVLYRMAATIQIVLVLSIMIYGYDIVMRPLYVILLALFNDISMLPIADDNASPSSMPDIPSMPEILLASVMYGALLTLQTLGIFEFALHSSWLSGSHAVCEPGNCDYIRTVVYLQISIAIEFVIFSCRTPGFVFSPKYLWGDGRPSWQLILGVMFANVVVTLLSGLGFIVYKLEWIDILYVWAYNIVGLVVIDLLKVVLTSIGLPLMSAGAGTGVLGYPDLPVDAGQASMARSMGSRVSARSMVRTANGSSLHRSIGGASRSFEPKSASFLPFPYNLRADAERIPRSF